MERRRIAIIGHVGHVITTEMIRAAAHEINMEVVVMTSPKEYHPAHKLDRPIIIDEIPIASYNQKSKKQKKSPYQSMNLKHKFHK